MKLFFYDLVSLFYLEKIENKVKINMSIHNS